MELVPLVFGHEVVPRSLSLAGAGDEPVREPVTGALVGLGDGWLLLDTGLPPDSPPGLAELYPHGLPEREPLAATLARAGVRPDEVRAAAVSHLHLDHTGGLRELPGVPVWVQRAELAWAAGRGVGEGVWARDAEGVDWRLVDGDAELVPGVLALATPGHTPGHMSFAVGERWVLACDAIDLAEGLEEDREIGPATEDDDPAARRASHDRLMALHRAGRRVVPGHCPRTWPPLAFRRLAV